MKNALTTNTLEAEGYGEGKFAPPRPQGFVKERNKAQTEDTTRQVGAMSTIFVPGGAGTSGSFVGKGFSGKQDAVNVLLLHVLDDDQMLFKANFDALFYALGIRSRSWA